MSQDQPARAGRALEIETPSGAIDAYLAHPASGAGPGVVVIQEWWGLVDHIRDVCDRLARAGFVALAPDLYRGESTTDPGEAGRLMMDLEIDRAAGDLDAAIERLRRQDGIEGPRVGVIGFCMGGQLALSASARNPKVGACVDCYGVHPNVSVDHAKIEGAVLGIFAEHDDFIPLETVRALEASLKDADVDAEIEIFPGTQHAFLNETRAEVHDATGRRARVEPHRVVPARAARLSAYSACDSAEHASRVRSRAASRQAPLPVVRRADTTSAAHPAIRHSPPSGVTGPSQRGPPRARA